MSKNQNIQRNKNYKSFSKKMKTNTKKYVTSESIFIKLLTLLKIRISLPNYETLSKSKTWGSKYKIDQIC